MTGSDVTPIVVFKHCPVCKTLHVELIQHIWDEEVVPAGFGEIKFVTIYKNKDDADDPSKHQCLDTLNHSYKVLSQHMIT